MALLAVPTIIVVTGEGGSGGALGIAVGDCVLMQEYAVYSVIPPEGCAAILWRDAEKKVEAADALKIRTNDLVGLGIVDQVVPEPLGGAHTDPDDAAELLLPILRSAVARSSALSAEDRLDQRYGKLRQLGNLGLRDTPPAGVERPPG